MIEKTVIFGRNAVLSAKEAATFVAEAKKYDSEIWIEKGSRRVDGRSIMSIMSLAGLKDNILTIGADGVDEVAAVDVLYKTVQSCAG